jgi:hypothetical protein
MGKIPHPPIDRRLKMFHSEAPYDSVPCTKGPDCPICAEARGDIVLKNFAKNDGSTVSLSRADFDNIERSATIMVDVAEKYGLFNSGNLYGVELPLSNGVVIFSIRKTVDANGKANYEWMLDKK